MAKSLIDSGLVEQLPDPRRSLYRLSDSSSDTRNAALDALTALEGAMMARSGISASDMKVFRKVLASNWGPEVIDEKELRASNKCKKGKTNERRGKS